MRFHREGRNTLLITGFVFCLAAIVFGGNARFPLLTAIVMTACVVIYALLLNFFRNPSRTVAITDDNLIYAPADGTVVVIEETEETEYFTDKRLQISIFMSPLNVHVNRIPTSGRIAYQKYHQGKYLVAFNPKSSTENERNTIVVDHGRFAILIRQIAGAVARRIVWYVKAGDPVTQGQEFGFIKFGSRVDTFLPLNAQVEVKIGQKVFGNKTVIASIPG